MYSFIIHLLCIQIPIMHSGCRCSVCSAAALMKGRKAYAFLPCFFYTIPAAPKGCEPKPRRCRKPASGLW